MPPLAKGVLSNLSGRKNETFEVSVISPLSGALNNCERDLAYSFDDGPSIYHGEVEMLFDNAKAKYTSFVNGMNWSCIYDENNVQSLRKAVAAGHQIGSHTWSHAHLNSLTPEQQDLEIERLEEALWKIIGRVPAYFRPPYGECDKNCVERLNKKHGLTVVTWDVDSGDSVGASPSASIATLNALKYPQAHMPLSHETYQSSVETVAPAVVPSLQKQGYKLMTIQQCLGGKVPPYKIIGKPQERDETWTCANNV
ncbi:glycoside hydrolase deacetylase [Ceraceosorus bombacis]|uniref:Glycoside hydrolase deacetylase n=1 Tax=Ceraceosorus bombacis TaxID=401625 RepID=A0A0N7LAD5_9BASI|nr:glycoside hydrolase deacetylase [Ceraceosorus bombacis]